MPLSKAEIITGLYQILTSKIAANRFYNARCRGFRSELELPLKAREIGWDLLDGGMCFFTRQNWPANKDNSIVYVTVSADDAQRYVGFYQNLSRLSVLDSAYFIEIGARDSWTVINIPVKNENQERVDLQIPQPVFTVKKFVNGAFQHSSIAAIITHFPAITGNGIVCRCKSRDGLNYIEQYPVNDLAKAYSNRFFLAITLGRVSKGMIDFDGILNENGNFSLIETKEKDPIQPSDNRDNWLFGWDSRRISWYLYLKNEIGLDAHYVVREVNNQTDRVLVAWKKISLEQFCKSASWLSEHSGGGGSGTITAPYLRFTEF